MSFDGLLINKMKTIQLTGDEWSEPTESVGKTIPCRIMYDTRLMKDYKGEEVLSAAKVFVKPKDINFHHEDRVRFDIETYQVDHPIITIKQPQDSTHIHHAEVWVQ